MSFITYTGVYRDTESGVRYYRPELLRMIEDLQPGDVVIAEQMDRLSRGSLAEAEQLVAPQQGRTPGRARCGGS